MTKQQFDRLMKRTKDIITEEVFKEYGAGSGIPREILRITDRALARLDDETTLATWLREDPLA